jgi:hypothetical protein
MIAEHLNGVKHSAATLDRPPSKNGDNGEAAAGAPPSKNGDNGEAAAGAPPSINGDNGRTARGRFANGNRGGPGNPFARQMARMRRERCSTGRAAAGADDALVGQAALPVRARDRGQGQARLPVLRCGWLDLFFP